MYAVIELSGHQWIVTQGDQIVVDRLDGEKWSTITLDQVLLWFAKDGTDVKVGAPYVPSAQVTATIVDHKKGDKVRSVKFQGKKRYHKVKGLRPSQTVLSIESVTL